MRARDQKISIALPFGKTWMLVGGVMMASSLVMGQNVGIAVNNPVNRLQIGSVGSSGFFGNDIAIGNGTQVMSFFQSAAHSFWYTNTHFALMHINNTGGNLRIGSIIDNTAKLHVYGGFDYGNTVHAMRISGNNPFIDFSDAGGQVNYGFLRSRNNNTTGGFPIGLEIGVTPPPQGQPVRAITFSTNYGPRMTIADNGNVGIGVINPATSLEIRKSRPEITFSQSEFGNDFVIGLFESGTAHISTFQNTMLLLTGDVTLNNGSLTLRSSPAGGDAFRLKNTAGWVGNTYIQRLDFLLKENLIATISSTGTYTTISDSTLKTNTTKVDESFISKLDQLQLYRYRFLHENADAKLSLGFMAQNVQREFPELVQEIENNGKKMLTVDASKYGILAIKAIQEQQELIVALQQQNKVLTERLEKLEKKFQ